MGQDETLKDLHFGIKEFHPFILFDTSYNNIMHVIIKRHIEILLMDLVNVIIDTNVSPLLPVPDVTLGKRPSKCEHSEIITSEAYRSRLAEKQKNPKRKAAPAKKKLASNKKKRGESSKATFKNLVNQACVCPVCETPQSNVDDGEQWVECLLCTVMAHKSCSSENVCFICKET